MPSFQLFAEIVSLSQAPKWEQARLEWELEEISFGSGGDSCLCGHYPIVELCKLRNKINNNIAIIGNCCVKKFIKLPSDKIFKSIKRVKKDNNKSFNNEAIEYAKSNKWINDWEYGFYKNIMKKLSLTEKQVNTKLSINMRILLLFTKQK